jgi:hypothetical protein
MQGFVSDELLPWNQNMTANSIVTGNLKSMVSYGKHNLPEHG